ncbi:amino acid adenylation domain-containing protein [Streptomyces sp. NPDC088400]|uniref:amino acid adenylation domain-containing protein n=1 Tax=Streptomyces sp. NPDC088400 TaxID=3365861 RepID=UPI0037F609A1
MDPHAREPAPAGSGTLLPLSSYQRDIWATAVIHPDDPQYNCCLTERLTGSVDLDLMAECIERALRRHETFLLRFDERNGTPVQWVGASVTPVERVDLSGEDDPALACRTWWEREMLTTLPLRGQPMVRATLLVEGPDVVNLHLKAHHLVADGFSCSALLFEVIEDYARCSYDSAHSDLSDLSDLSDHSDPRNAPAQPTFESLLEQEAAYLSTADSTADRAALRAALEGVRPALFPRPAVTRGTRRREKVIWELHADVVERIRAAGHTPFSYIATVVGGYLARLHGTDEVVLGVPLLNRRHWEGAPLGQLANTLPLRVRDLAATPVDTLVRKVREDVRELQRHERVALGDVLNDLVDAGAGPGSRQLFDVTISSLRFERPSPVPGIGRESDMRAPGYEASAINIFVRDFHDVPGIQIELVYLVDLFDADLPMAAVVRHLANLMSGCLDAPHEPLPALPVMDATEHAAVHALGQGPSVPASGPQTLHGLFERRCAQHPERTAVTEAATGRSLSYGELNRRADQLAGELHALGVGRGDRVAVAMERGLDLMTAVFGVLKAGAAYVPVDPGHPDDRVAFLLDDSRAAVVLLDDGSTGKPWAALPHAHRASELLNRPARALAPPAPPAPLAPLPPGSSALPTDLAYVIYTSGSTGQPKGVMVEHRSVANRLAWMQRLHPVGADDVLLQKTPISFDVSVWELFWWAAEGARLVLLPPGAEKDPQEVLRVVREHDVGVLHFVPSMFGPFMDAVAAPGDINDGGDADGGDAQVPPLRYVFCSGEALQPEHVERFARLRAEGPDGRTRLVNLYGPTEAAVDVTSWTCPDEPGERVYRVPIGRPVDNTSLYVLDPLGSPQPVGIPGELHIGGVQVARGYLGRPELTGERFVPDPFTPDGRLYRTGDVARWLADGTLECLGRADGQVKIRGNRVETGEVASALRAQPGVGDGVVAADVVPGGGTRLIGYYTADGADPGASRLRAALAARLPGYMVPALLCRIDRIPLTPSGKTDLRALPDPRDLAAPDNGNGPHTYADSPDGATQAALAAIWEDVLGVGHVGPHDDFYALGGDSILVLTVRARAEAQGLTFHLADLVEHPTVEALAARTTTSATPPGTLATPGRPGGARPQPAHPPFHLVSRIDRAALGDAQDAFPLTRLQLGLLFHSRREQTSATYKDVFQYTLRIPWDEATFLAAVEHLVVRHPALRSTFALALASEPLQVVHDDSTGRVGAVDLRARPEPEARALITRHVEERRFHDYDLDQGPLWSLHAFAVQDTVELVVAFHHALLDGGSVANLLRDLLQDYTHALGLHSDPVGGTPLPPPTGHVAAERQALTSAEAGDHWRQVLASDAPSAPPALRAHRPPADERLIVRRIELPADLTAAVRATARTRGVPIKSLLLAAHCLTLGVFTGAPEAISGVITHGRTEEDGEDALGLFLNTVPVRLPMTAESWLHLAREALRQERAGYPHRRYPLSAIQEDSGGRELETAFNYVHFRQLAQVLTLPGVELENFRTWEETNFALLVNAVHDAVSDKIELRIDCDGRHFSADQADLLADTLLTVLRRVAEHPDEKTGFGFLAAGPTRITAVPDALPVTTQFLARAAAVPESRALVLGDRQWSYAQLADTARTVGHRLVAAGTRPGDRIGVTMDRSADTVAVLIGVLLAGAAVVPLDPAYPPARLKAMATVARPRYIVANAPHARLIEGCAPQLAAESLTAPDSEPDLAYDGEPDHAPGPACAAIGLPAPVPDSTAYVLFTSGSTGEPKGVAMPHGALANLVSWQNSVSSGAVGGTTLQFASMNFDVSFQEIFSTLCGGGTLVLTTESQRHDMRTLLRLMDDEGVERVFLPYVALQHMAEASEALNLVPRRLRVVVSSGEQLRVTSLMRRFLAALPTSALLENQYGPTETHVVTAFTMTGDPATFPELPPIGRPIDGTEAHVLDEELRPVPTGVEGQLYLGGRCLAEGYEGRPDLTRQRFVTLPSRTVDERLYRSGDLAIVLPDGDIVCTGRADRQVKVRGHRVEPAEVETAVLGWADGRSGITQVAVVPRASAGNGTVLAAFLVGAPDAVSLNGLRDHLRTVLPAYMLPAHLTWLPELPLTSSGKRDDQALSRVPLAAPEVPAGTPPTPGTHEAELVEILADLLDLPVSAVGLHDDLFDLGVTSLTAMRLMVTVEQRYGVALPMSEFLSTPTVSGLARRLDSTGAEFAFNSLVPIHSRGSRRPLFMVHPMGGNVLCYVQLARHLPEEQPLYAFQAAGVAAGSQPRTSVQKLAADYIAAMRQVQPHGPYTIGGWSFGGFVAFEMAVQLRRAGEEVAELMLLDTTALAPGHRAAFDDDAVLGWFFWELLWLERGGTSPLEIIPDGLVTLEEKFAFIADFAVDTGVLPPGSTDELVERLFAVYRANWSAALAYRPDPPDQDLTLLLAAEPLPEVLLDMHSAGGSQHADATNGWRHMTTGRLRTVTVPGDHLSIIEPPHVEHTAGVIGRILDGSFTPSPQEETGA